MYTVHYCTNEDDLENFTVKTFTDPDRAREFVKAHRDQWPFFFIERSVTMDTTAFLAGDSTALAGYARDWDR